MSFTKAILVLWFLLYCLGVEFLWCLHLMCVFIFLVSGHLLGNSCSLGLRYVFLVYVPNCQFTFFLSWFLEWDFLSDCTISWSLSTCIQQLGQRKICLLMLVYMFRLVLYMYYFSNNKNQNHLIGPAGRAFQSKNLKRFLTVLTTMREIKPFLKQPSLVMKLIKSVTRIIAIIKDVWSVFDWRKISGIAGSHNQ